MCWFRCLQQGSFDSILFVKTHFSQRDRCRKAVESCIFWLIHCSCLLIFGEDIFSISRWHPRLGHIAVISSGQLPFGVIDRLID